MVCFSICRLVMGSGLVLSVYFPTVSLWSVLAPLDFVLVVGLIFIAGLGGVVFMPRNLIVVLMCIELLVVSLAFMFVFVALLYGSASGYLFGYLLLVVAGAESVIALSVLTFYFFVEQHIHIEFVQRLKG